MKKIVNVFFVLIIMISSVVKAQTSFEGTIVYQSIIEGDDVPELTKQQMKYDMIMKFKGNKVRTEMKTPMGEMILIVDSKTQESVALMSMLGQKLAIKSPPEKIEEQLSEFPVGLINETGETKVIAGYTCNKVVFTVNEESSTLYYTKDLNVNLPNWSNEYKDIDGVMLEFTKADGNGISMRMVASSVTVESLDDSLFEVPAGYKEMKDGENPFGF